jgi:hypothetical protein
MSEGRPLEEEKYVPLASKVNLESYLFNITKSSNRTLKEANKKGSPFSGRKL